MLIMGRVKSLIKISQCQQSWIVWRLTRGMFISSFCCDVTLRSMKKLWMLYIFAHIIKVWIPLFFVCKEVIENRSSIWIHTDKLQRITVRIWVSLLKIQWPCLTWIIEASLRLVAQTQMFWIVQQTGTWKWVWDKQQEKLLGSNGGALMWVINISLYPLKTHLGL